MTEGTDMHVRHTAVADARICRQADDALAVYLHDLRLVTEAVEQHLALAWSDGSEFLAVGGVGDDHQAAEASGTQGRLRGKRWGVGGDRDAVQYSEQMV